MGFMDEVVLKGVSLLDYASQIELARYIMNRNNWVIVKANAVSAPLVGSRDREVAATSFLFNQKQDSRLKRAPVAHVSGKTVEKSYKFVRPLKKRSVVDISIAE